MNMQEFLMVKNFTYLEYCDYLQDKYGIGLDDYFTKSFNPKPKCKRTKEGLYAHHKKEDTFIMLSKPEMAKLCPFEWQSKENIVYCDFLEHLLLHILICKYPSEQRIPIVDVGIGGITDFLIPELNDLYSGFVSKQAWIKTCHDKVRQDKDVYLALVQMFIEIELQMNKDAFNIEWLYSSFNHNFGLWDIKNNVPLLKEIQRLYNEATHS